MIIHDEKVDEVAQTGMSWLAVLIPGEDLNGKNCSVFYIKKYKKANCAVLCLTFTLPNPSHTLQASPERLCVGRYFGGTPCILCSCRAPGSVHGNKESKTCFFGK